MNQPTNSRKPDTWVFVQPITGAPGMQTSMITGNLSQARSTNNTKIITSKSYVQYGEHSTVTRVSIRMHVHINVSGTTSPNVTKFSVHVTYGRGSDLLWRQCDMLCTFGFVDDVTLLRMVRNMRYEIRVYSKKTQQRLPSVFWHCLLEVKKSIRPVKIERWGVGVINYWSEVQIVCIWSSWCHCHLKTPPSLASFKSRLVLPFWYRLTQVVLKKRPLNGCGSSSRKKESTAIIRIWCCSIYSN